MNKLVADFLLILLALSASASPLLVPMATIKIVLHQRQTIQNPRQGQKPVTKSLFRSLETQEPIHRTRTQSTGLDLSHRNQESSGHRSNLSKASIMRHIVQGRFCYSSGHHSQYSRIVIRKTQSANIQSERGSRQALL